MTLTKTLKFDDRTLDILTTHFQVEAENGHFVGKLACGQLDRKAYENVNKALEALGGKWTKKIGGHIFPTDPRLELNALTDTGSLQVTRDGWFPTPLHIVYKMIDAVGLKDYDWVLEPSAGDGAIADAVCSYRLNRQQIECVELNPKRAAILQEKGYSVYPMNFLETSLHTFGMKHGFDRVFMNPPFEEGQDIDHVKHAYKLLTPHGALVSIMSEGPFFNGNKKATEFREWLEGFNGQSWRLPADAFKESGTGVQTRMVVIYK